MALLMEPRGGASAEAHGGGASPLGSSLRAALLHAQRVQMELQERRAAVAAVDALVQLSNELQVIEECIKAGKLVQAAHALRSLQAPLGLQAVEGKLATDQAAKEPPYFILETFQQDWVARHTQLKCRLGEVVSQNVVLDQRKCELRVTCRQPTAQASPTYGKALESLQALDLLEEYFASLSEDLFQAVLVALTCQADVGLEEVQRSSPTSDAILTWHITDQAATAHPKPTELYSKLLVFMGFLLREVLQGDQQRLCQLGWALWPRLADAVIAGCLSKAVPNETAELVQFQQVASETRRLESSLADMGLFDLLKRDSDKEHFSCRLSNYAADVDMHFASKRRRKVQARAQALIKTPGLYSCKDLQNCGGMKWTDGKKELRAGLPPFFQWEACAVSIPIHELADLVRESLDEAVKSTPRTAMELYRASRDALLLFQAVAPAKFDAVLTSDTRQAMVFHNDCLFLKHLTLTLAFQYQRFLPQPLPDIVTYLDMVPQLRQLAEETRLSQMERQKQKLDQALEGADGFRSTDNERHLGNAKGALRKAISELKAVGDAWRPVLAWSVYVESMTELIDKLFTLFIFNVLNLRDMAVEETVQLKRLADLLLSDLVPLLFPKGVKHSTTLREEAESLSTSHPGAADVLEGLLSYRKLRRLADLLDMSLLFIRQAWESRDLLECGFSSQEVRKLIEAIFSDTPLRKDCIIYVSRQP
eukprot:SM000011S19124  [mRNA]  locus=s11:1026405:1031270:+ [translate_table: standard]